MPFNPNIPEIPRIDDSLRVLQTQAPGLMSFDNAFSQAQNLISLPGDNLQSLKDRVTDDLTAKLNQVYENKLNPIQDKVLYYPESLRNIDNSTFANPSSFEVPRHALKITISEYYGANIGTIDGNKILDTIKNLSGKLGSLGNFAKNAALSAVGIGDAPPLDFSQFAPLFQPESLAAQNRISGAAPDITSALRQLSNTSKLQVQDSLKSFVNDNINSPIGATLMKNALSGGSKALSEISTMAAAESLFSKSGVKIKLLPDEVKNIIYLYAPGNNLDYNYNTKWKSTELDNITFGALNSLSMLMKGEISNSIGGAFETATGILKNAIPFEGVRTLIDSKTGMTPAQNYEYMFDSVDRRKFGVSITFMPKSDKEVANIGKIIAALKYYSHPSRPNMAYHYRAPAVFMLENITWTDGKWAENLYLPKYKLAALQNINLRYDQNGALITHEEYADSIKRNGTTFKSPIKIVMGLSFEELVIVTREDLTPPQHFFDSNRKNGYY